MLKFNHNVKRIPFGGHHYPEYGITFKGESVGEVAKKVKAFRIGNNIPVGDPEQDVLVFYAKNWPWLVKGSPFFREVMEDADYVAWRDWVFNAWKNPGATITTKEARDRWDVCEKCPFNKRFKWEATDESNEITRRAFLLRKGVEVPMHLGFCACHRADLSVITFLKEPEKFSAKKDGEGYEGCWLGSSLRDHKAAPVTQ